MFDDHAGAVNTQMELLPASRATSAVLRGGLLPSPTTESRAIAFERGASAWVWHTDRIWSYAGREGQSADHVAAAYEAFFRNLIIGAPVGMAARFSSQHGATLALRLGELSDELAGRDGRGARAFAQLWMAKQNLSNTFVLGDPLARHPRDARLRPAGSGAA